MTSWLQNAPLSMIEDFKEGMKSSEKLKLKRKGPANKSNSRFSKGHFWENKMCQNSITCQSKLSFWVSKIKIGPLLSYFIFKCFYFIQDLSDKLRLTDPYFTPISFDKFFETGQFEEKTNSVQCKVFYYLAGNPSIEHLQS